MTNVVDTEIGKHFITAHSNLLLLRAVVLTPNTV